MRLATDCARLATTLFVLAAVVKVWLWLPVIGWNLAETNVRIRNQEIQLTKLEQTLTTAVAPNGLIDTRLFETNGILYRGIQGTPMMTPYGPAHVGGLMGKLSTLNESVQMATTSFSMAMVGSGGIMDTVATVGQSVNEVADQAAIGLRQANDAFPMWNSRFLAVSGEAMHTMDHTRRFMVTVQRESPRLIQSFQKIADNAAEATGYAKEYVRPVPWYKQPSMIGKVGVGLCRILC